MKDKTIFKGSVFHSLYNNEANSFEYEDFYCFYINLLSNQRVVSSKRDGPLWSPALYGANRTRSVDNVLYMTAYVADFDGGPTFDEIKDRMSGYEFTYAMVSTYHNCPEKNHFHLIIPFKKNIAASEWDIVWPFLHSKYGEGSDIKCKDTSRIYFLRTCCSDSSIYNHQHFNHHDNQLDVREERSIAWKRG